MKSMSGISRRSFIGTAAAALPATRSLLADPLTRQNLGAELYTVRNIIGKDPAKVLKAIQEIGYTEVEATAGNLDQIWPALKQTNLQAISLHLGSDHSNAALSSAKQRGFQYVVVPYLPLPKNGQEGVKKYADMLNSLGEQAKSNGLTLCYHNHAHDLTPMGNSTLLDILLSETKDNLVFLEMDIFWVSVAGHDPVQMLQKYSGRVPLVHLKDKAKNVPVQYSEQVPHDAFKSVGSGSIDIPAVLTAAAAAGVRHYFVEQDQTPGDPIDALRQSYNYLKGQFKG